MKCIQQAYPEDNCPFCYPSRKDNMTIPTRRPLQTTGLQKGDRVSATITRTGTVLMVTNERLHLKTDSGKNYGLRTHDLDSLSVKMVKPVRPKWNEGDTVMHTTDKTVMVRTSKGDWSSSLGYGAPFSDSSVDGWDRLGCIKVLHRSDKGLVAQRQALVRQLPLRGLMPKPSTLPAMGDTVVCTITGTVVSHDRFLQSVRVRTADPSGGWFYSTIYPEVLHTVEVKDDVL